MIKTLTFILLFFIIKPQNSFSKEDEVIIIPSNDFDNFILEHDFVFAFFTSSNCASCNDISIAISNLAKKMNKNPNSVKIVKTNIGSSKDFLEKYDIQAFPSLSLFLYGNSLPFRGNLEPENVEKWINQKLNFKIKEITDFEQVKSIAKSNLSVLLALQTRSKKLINDLKSLSSFYDQVPFYFTFLDEIQSWIGSTKSNHFIVFRDFDNGKAVLADDIEFSFKIMKGFFDQARFSTVVDLSEETAQEIFTSGKTIVIFFSENSNFQLAREFKDAASNFKDEFRFVRSTISTGIGQRFSDYFGITKKDNDSIILVVQTGTNWNKYKLIGKISKTSIIQFIDDFKDGKLTKYYKSESLSGKNNSFVKKVVGNTLNDVVLKPGKDVVLFVIADHCEICTKIAPMVESLAKQLRRVDSLVFGVINMTLNEHEVVKFDGFPAIRLYKKNDKSNPIELEGHKDFVTIYRFLQTHIDEELDLADEFDEIETL